MTAEEVRTLLRQRIEEAGSAAAFARAHGVSPIYVADVARERRQIGPAIHGALGLRAETSVDYRPVEAAHG